MDFASRVTKGDLSVSISYAHDDEFGHLISNPAFMQNVLSLFASSPQEGAEKASNATARLDAVSASLVE